MIKGGLEVATRKCLNHPTKKGPLKHRNKPLYQKKILSQSPYQKRATETGQEQIFHQKLKKVSITLPKKGH